MVTFDPRRCVRRAFPRSLDERHDEIFADECAEQSNLVSQDIGESGMDRVEIDLCANALEPFKRAPLTILRHDIREPGELGRCNMKRAHKQRSDSGRPEHRMEPSAKVLAQEIEGGRQLGPIRHRGTAHASERVLDETSKGWRTHQAPCESI
jgi:hypothetical protein